MFFLGGIRVGSIHTHRVSVGGVFSAAAGVFDTYQLLRKGNARLSLRGECHHQSAFIRYPPRCDHKFAGQTPPIHIGTQNECQRALSCLS